MAVGFYAFFGNKQEFSHGSRIISNGNPILVVIMTVNMEEEKLWDLFKQRWAPPAA